MKRTPEIIGKIWGEYELEDERSISSGIEGVEEFLTWDEGEMDRFFEAKAKAFKAGFLKALASWKEAYHEEE